MNDRNWNKISSILDTLLTISKEKRTDYLDTHFSDQPDVIAEVKEYLRSIEESEKEGFLNNNLEDHAALFQDLSSVHFPFNSLKDTVIGKKVGPYEIESELGTGGMGSVYKAIRQDGQFNQTVAIKFINAKGFSDAVIERFRMEQEVLANLNHPNIATLFDGGFTEEGFPYLIMEYVQGLPIDEYCQKHQLLVSDRLALFKKILAAIQHAHSNLVIHRDLKPSNILIDEEQNLKVLDFGIAKTLSIKDGQNVDLTQIGERVWTPSYAAPEQILERPSRIQTDIYGLGALLYSILTNSTPFDFKNRSLHEVEKMILEENPRSLAEGFESENENHSNTQSKKDFLRGDLEAIVRKSLRKEPEERYESAGEFLEDLERYQQNLPVHAVNGSFKYKSRKFLKRNLKMVSTATAFLSLLITVVSLYTIRLSSEQQKATTEAQKANEVKTLLLEVFENADPLSGADEVLTVQELLENGTDEILSRDLNPEVKSEMLISLSSIYQNITEYEKALEIAETALSHNIEHFDSLSIPVLQTYLRLSSINNDLANFDRAYELSNLSVEIAEQILSDNNPLWSQIYLMQGDIKRELAMGSESLQSFQQAMEVLEYQPEMDSSMYIDILRKLGRAHYLVRNLDQADSVFTVALSSANSFYGEDKLATSTVMDEAGVFYMTQGMYDKARGLFNNALEIKRVKHQGAHPNISSILNNLAVLEDYSENYPEADSLYAETLEMDTEIYGPDHPYIASSKGHWANMNIRIGNFDKAAELIEDVIRINTMVYDSEHPVLGRSYKNMGEIKSAEGELEVAEEYFIMSDNIYSKVVEPTSRTYAELSMSRAENSFKREAYLEAANQYETAIAGFELLSDEYFFWMEAECTIKMAKSYILAGRDATANQILSSFESRMDTTRSLKEDDIIRGLYTSAKEMIK